MKFICTTRVKKILSSLVFVLIAVLAQSQTSTSNPYSRFGIGILENPGSAIHFGMGGVTTSIADGNSVNLFNPASYSQLSRTVFQIGGTGQFQTLSNTSGTESYSNGRVNDISLGFKKSTSPWGFALGLTPFSSVGYNLTSTVEINDSTSTSYLYDGTGGINKLVVGASRQFKLYKPLVLDPTITGNARQVAEMRIKESNDSLSLVAPVLSIGLNANYYFGTIQLDRRVQFSNTTFFSTRITEKTTIYDFDFEAGAMYTMPLAVKWDGKKIKKATHLRIGADYQLGTSLKTKHDELGMAYLFSSSTESEIDTTYYTGIQKGSFNLPSRLSVGASVIMSTEGGRILSLNGEYRQQDWSSNSYLLGTDGTSSLKQYQNISLGVEYTPHAIDKAKSLLGRSTYRVGIRTTESYLALSDQDISQNAISAGFSIPILASKSTSKVNFGIEYGTGGTTDNNLLQEKFVRVQFGFSLTPYFLNPWFVVRKYD
ncbi:MAG: hypothetical protein RL204_2399 [Bacteroidota bacterium]|jgi:hypothetical protein